MSQLELITDPTPDPADGTTARRKPKGDEAPPAGQGGGGSAGIVDGDLAEQARRKYLNYALSVITSRAIPDVRDGLKPVQRRIMFTMFDDLHLTFDARHRKSAKVVGDVIGKYHPHGDSAVYDAMVRMAQDFAMRDAAGRRPGQLRLDRRRQPGRLPLHRGQAVKLASELLVELKSETVEYRPTYDGTGLEPIVLPARFPHLLVNGATGIAVGMATAIPPHNLGEVIRGLLDADRRPDAHGRQADGQASRARTSRPAVSWSRPSRSCARPTRKAGAPSSCAAAGSSRQDRRRRAQDQDKTASPAHRDHRGPLGRREERDRRGDRPDHHRPQAARRGRRAGPQSTEDIRVEVLLDPKGDVDPELVMAYLFKHTPLADHGQARLDRAGPDRTTPRSARPRGSTSRRCSQQFLEFRLQTVRRRFEHELRKLEERIHILEGFEKIFDELDRAIKLIRTSDGKADAATKLMKALRARRRSRPTRSSTPACTSSPSSRSSRSARSSTTSASGPRRIRAILKSEEQAVGGRQRGARGAVQAVRRQAPDPDRRRGSDRGVLGRVASSSRRTRWS